MDSQLYFFSLDNGLQIIIKPVHTTPLVSSWLWYRVGSRNEVEGKTGLSHWVEHMLFKGSAKFPKGSIMRLVDRVGGTGNAMTSHDFTAFYETLPSAQIRLALEVESDRMSTALFDPEEVESERTVIISEREGGENEPIEVLHETLVAEAFRAHPYHHQTIGWKEDLRAITRDDLYAHYQHYYQPGNAVLVLAGDVEPEQVMPQVADLFGPIASMPVLDAIEPEPQQHEERRVTVRLPGSTPIVQVAYHVPPVSHPDYIPLVILNGILSGGNAPFSARGSLARSARLYRALVETQLASSASSSYHISLDPYLFTLGAIVRQGRAAEQVERAFIEVIRRLQQELVSAEELRVSIRQTQAQLAYANESAANQALALGILAVVDRYTRQDGFIDELATVAPADVQRVAQTYFTASSRTVGWFEPLPGGAQ